MEYIEWKAHMCNSTGVGEGKMCKRVFFIGNRILTGECKETGGVLIWEKIEGTD